MDRYYLLIILLILLTSHKPINNNQTVAPAIIKGAIYDLNENIIPDIPIYIENIYTGEIVKATRNKDGTYNSNVRSGRYKVRSIPNIGYPFGAEHASFQITDGETVTINLRPLPVAVSTSLEKRGYISRYDGKFPTIALHFIPQEDKPAIRDLRIQYYTSTSDSQKLIYRTANSSFERYAFQSDELLFDTATNRLTVRGKVRFDDGQQTRILKSITIDLSKAAIISEE